MNINAVRLVFVGTKTGSVVMCKIFMLVVTFLECVQINAIFLGHDSLPLILIIQDMYIICNAWFLDTVLEHQLVFS